MQNTFCIYTEIDSRNRRLLTNTTMISNGYKKLLNFAVNLKFLEKVYFNNNNKDYDYHWQPTVGPFF